MRSQHLQLILASSSPRRAALLRMLGLKFKVIPSNAQEALPKEGGDPREFCVANARLKALEVAGRIKCRAVVIGADTIVYHKGRVMGKPRTLEEAKRMLRSLSGGAHEVYTGLCVVRNDTWAYAAGYEVTRVYFKELSEREIEVYVNLENPLDKAGAYAIQGLASLFVRKIEGDFFNVVGLPLHKLYELLSKIGFNLLEKLASEG